MELSSHELLKIALEGSAEDWAALQNSCLDRRFAEVFADALLRTPEEHRAEVAAWILVIKEFHPDLQMLRVESSLASVPSQNTRTGTGTLWRGEWISSASTSNAG